MQLVEQGKLSLDDPALVSQLAPELAVVKVLVRDASGGFRLEEKIRPITLRLLLNHTGTLGPKHLCLR